MTDDPNAPETPVAAARPQDALPEDSGDPELDAALDGDALDLEDDEEGEEDEAADPLAGPV
ncbi:MAG TPA: hypothetical protein VFE93_02800, partial [Myxococcaceae bacterium]|nr:hypothetical protein [Myxococcaceae bacterium]